MWPTPSHPPRGLAISLLLPAVQSRILDCMPAMGEQAIAAGIISIDDLRRGDTAACTLRGEGDSRHEDDFLAGVRKRSPPG